ncbi:MAG: ATP-binding protein [Marinifilaceae bacterium]
MTLSNIDLLTKIEQLEKENRELQSQLSYFINSADQTSDADHLQFENIQCFQKPNDQINCDPVRAGKLNSDEKSTVSPDVLKEITEERKSKEALIQAKEKAEESNRLKSAFLANMSHEIRTPMNGILGFANMLDDPHLSQSEKKLYVQIINESGQQLLSIINDIIDISKIEAGQISLQEESVCLLSFLQEIQHFFQPRADEKGLKFRLLPPPQMEDTHIRIDQVKLRQVITNLLTNAFKFTHEGFVEFGCLQENNQLQFFVKDSGIGIPAKEQNYIFDRFRQANSTTSTKYGGTGLGLAISKAYIEIMGGTIALKSQEGEGTQFYFSIPFNSSKTQEETPSNQSLTRNWKNRKILIAEDEEFNYLFLEEILRPTGVELIRAENGNKAIQLCREHSDLNLVLMDIKMPNTNGIEATLQIRKFEPDLPIIAQTAYAYPEDRDKALEAGCNDYITKPIDRTILLNLLNNYFGE